MGYKFQFITLAGFHSLNYGMFELARAYKDRGMAAYAKLQNAEFAAEAHGYAAHRHQREVGAGWFDAISVAAKGGNSVTTALADSTEVAQFKRAAEYRPRSVAFCVLSASNGSRNGLAPLSDSLTQ